MSNWYDTIVTALTDAIDAVFLKKSDKVNSWSGTPSDNNVPSEKLVKDSIDAVIESGVVVDSSLSDTSKNPVQNKVIKSALDGKVDKENGKGLFTGSYNDLTNKPSIPSKTSDLTNDSNFISTSNTVGLVKNDGSIDTNTYITHHQSLTNYIQKSETAGLVKNDGTIDTNSYLTASAISGKIDTAGTGLTKSGTTLSADIGGSSSTSSSKLVACNDSRLSDARTPTSHTHGDITNTGTIGSTANLPLITTTNGKIATGSFGTTANTFCQGNDSRLSDARTPLFHRQEISTISTSDNELFQGVEVLITYTDNTSETKIIAMAETPLE